MKKLSILIALCLLVTVGGVYATWSYATGTVASAETTPTISLSGLGTATDKGTIAVTLDGASIVIDQADAAYNPKLVTAGSVKATFTPAAGASANVLDGIKAKYTVQWIGANSFKDDDGTTDVPIFAATSYESAEFNLTSTATEWNVSDLVAHLGLASFQLNSLEEYNRCKTVLAAGTFKVTVSYVAD